MSKRHQLPQGRAIFCSFGAAGSSNPLCFAGQPMTTRSQKAPLVTVILVHGAWADGSSWSEVIARLQAEGVPVVSVQNPLSSLADDVAAVRRAIELVDGPIVLVGHSWGGTVITQSGVSERVRALVYVAAFAPDRNESTNSLQAHYPPPEYASLLRGDSAGYLHFPSDALPHYFAQDLPSANAMVLAATQGPIQASAFDDKVTEVAWHTIPSWYLVADHDRMIPPRLQREMAQRMRARITEVPASHVPFASRPRETTAVILEAVAEVSR
jgi:pimeloyl-ACP methyl ester carboxylesterase